MERFFRSCYVLLFALWGAGSAAADDLWDIYLRALENDPQYAAAQARHQAGQEARVQGRAGLLPQIGLEAGASHMSSRPAGADDLDYGRFTWQVHLTQPLYRPQNLIASDQGVLRSQSSDISLLLARQQLILRVAEAYFNVLNAQDKLASVRQLRTAASEQLELATTSFELGVVTVTDVHEARSCFDLADAQVIQAESALDVESHRLTEIIGMPAGDLATLRQEAVFHPPQPERQQDWACRGAERVGCGIKTD